MTSEFRSYEAMMDFVHKKYEEAEPKNPRFYQINAAITGYLVFLRKQKDAQIKELLEALMSMVEQHCTTNDGKLDSWALSANAEAMHLLADHGLIDIEVDVGRRVLAKNKQQEQNDDNN